MAFPDIIPALPETASLPAGTRRRLSRSYWSVAAVIGVGLALTATMTVVQLQNATHERDLKLAAEIDARTTSLREGIRRYENMVDSLRLILEGSPRLPGRVEFDVIATGLSRGFDGVQSLGWMPRVPHAARAAFEAEAEFDGFAGFRFRERNAAGEVSVTGVREEYFPVYYAAPVKGNEAAIGYDVAADPERRPLLARARDTGRAAATSRVRLVVGGHEQWGVLIFAPVYAPAKPATVEARRASLIGFVVGVFRVGDMVDAILRQEPVAMGLDHYIFDAPALDAEHFLFYHRSRAGGGRDSSQTYTQIGGGPLYRTTVDLADSAWTVVSRPVAAPAGFAIEREAWALLLAGLLGTALTALYFFSAVRRSAHFEALSDRLAVATTIAENSPIVFTRWRFADTSGTPQPPVAEYVSANIRQFGYAPEDLLGRPDAMTATVHPEDREPLVSSLIDGARSGAAEVSNEFRLLRRDGEPRWVETRMAFERAANGQVRHGQGVMRDVTERKSAEAKINHMASHDVLTGLANRALFADAVGKAIARESRGGKGFAVLYLDLDHFKDVNDALGHPVGDKLLIAVADRLQANVRKIDTVARFGGDEFAVLATEIDDPGKAGALARKLIEVVSRPVPLDGMDIRCGTSIGIATYPGESGRAPHAEALLSHADVALYRAKAECRGTYSFFTESMDREVKSRFQLSNELRKAIAADELFMMYQPQVEIATGRIIGVEGLLRWRHPERGLLAPDIFVPVAEKSGLAIALGRWVLRTCCRQAKEWLDRGIAVPSMGVNLSGMQFKLPLDLEKDIDAVLSETGLSPETIELELTETTLMEMSKENNDVLLRLRARGMRIAIDDFGTGYSSLDYLRKFPVDRIKIAQNFVAEITSDPGGAAIVKATIGLAGALGLDLIAEGIETPEQLALLRDWGCNAAQGYMFARPLTCDALEPLLRAGRIDPATQPGLDAAA